MGGEHRTKKGKVARTRTKKLKFLPQILWIIHGASCVEVGHPGVFARLTVVCKLGQKMNGRGDARREVDNHLVNKRVSNPIQGVPIKPGSARGKDRGELASDALRVCVWGGGTTVNHGAGHH